MSKDLAAAYAMKKRAGKTAGVGESHQESERVYDDADLISRILHERKQRREEAPVDEFEDDAPEAMEAPAKDIVTKIMSARSKKDPA